MKTTTTASSVMLSPNNLFPTFNPKSSFSSSSSSSSSFSSNLPAAAAAVAKKGLYSSSFKTAYWVIKEQHIGITTVDYTSAEDADADDDDDESKSMALITAGAASLAILAVLMGQDDKAWAMGPEGPMVEEFWENVRRYGLYALTVSTGVLYAVLQPIVELLKNPISALLLILIIGGSFFVFSQILSAMFGVSDFDYQYAY